ncbi:hypothetical protein RJ639_042906 [Escallonia herrerae]|uniref:Uncharacterized protein n=1 Tax=Escallonia herrerae TaxID=1293975 RepID=A0AA88WE08_9ASTE|nr:hypothetical protein RJ639_042906 [Escallonia herrerae]
MKGKIGRSSLFGRNMLELMSGIIDTSKDAKLLRQKKIIGNALISEAEVAELFNGMSNSIQLTSVSYIGKAIKDVYKYYYNNGEFGLISTWKFELIDDELDDESALGVFGVLWLSFLVLAANIEPVFAHRISKRPSLLEHLRRGAHIDLASQIHDNFAVLDVLLVVMSRLINAH